MSGYDGEIRINTKIDVAEAQQELIKLQNHMNKTAQKIEDITKKMDSLKDAKIEDTAKWQNLRKDIDTTKERIQTLTEKAREMRNANIEDSSQWQELQQKISLTSVKMELLEAKAKKLEETKVPTDEYKQLSKEVGQTYSKLNALNERMEKWIALGKNTNSDSFKGMQYDAEKLKNTLNNLQTEWHELVVSGDGFESKVDTSEYKKIQSEINKTANEMNHLEDEAEKVRVAFSNQKGTDAYKAVKADLRSACEEMRRLKAEEKNLEVAFNSDKTAGINKLTGELAEANADMEVTRIKAQQTTDELKGINGDGFKKLSQSARKASDSVKKLAKDSTSANKGFSNLARSIKQMVLSMAVFTVMQKGIEFLKSGLQNLAVYSKEYNKSMSELTSSTSQLKNAFAVAFQPILNMVIPILSKLINWISAAANAVSRFFAILGGKSTYTKAIQQNKDYAASLDKVGGSADDAKGSLASYDELNVMQKNDSGSGGGGAGGADGSGFVEESVGDTSKFEAVKQALEEIVNIFKSGFATGLGDWESRMADIQEKTQMIKDALRDIFTDPEVVSGATKFGESILYNLGVVVGAVASIGLTIAQNLVGGIALYLTENTDRIKQYLINMFDIGTDIANLVGSFAESFAYVFEAFGSENGQQLTANLIGMFSDAFMGVTQLCWSLTRDLLNIIIQPFVENKEGFRTALEGFLGTAATVCGTLKETIDNTFDKLITVYDEHIKPFFDSVASGLSEIANKFLEFWNTYVQPVMDNLAAKFDEVMSTHIQPMLDKASELLGSIADALTVFWEQVLKPLIEWIIDNVLPVLLPIFENLYMGIMECFGFIADIITGFITVVQGIIDFLVGVFTGDWDKAWNAVSSIVSGVFDTVEAKINLVLTVIKTIVTTVLEAVKAKFEIIFKAIKDYVEATLNKAKGIITGVMYTIKKGIAQTLETIKSKWTEVWTSLKTTVVNIFNSIWTAIKGVINSILGGVESMANGVITGINNVIAALNNFKITFPDWVPLAGGNTLGFNLMPLNTISIPRLANGGITTGSTLANIGEAGREAVIPLERNTEWMNTFAEMLSGKIGGSGAQAIDLTVNLDGNQVYKRIVQLDREFAGRTGYSQFVY